LLHHDEHAEALDFVFNAIRRHAPEVLEAFRDWNQDDITEWAATYHLDTEALVNYATWFRDARSMAVDVTLQGLSRERAEWLKQSAERMPDPETQTLRKWRKRADDLYREAKAFSDHPTVKLNELRATRKRYAEWFVLRRVCEWSVADIQAHERNRRTPSAIEKGMRYIERVTRARPSGQVFESRHVR
jgi:hypothetical protein